MKTSVQKKASDESEAMRRVAKFLLLYYLAMAKQRAAKDKSEGSCGDVCV